MKKLFFVAVIIALLSFDLGASEAKSKDLKIYACGITRVAFINELAVAFKKKYKTKVAVNKKGGVIASIDATYKKKSHIGVGCRILFKRDKREKTMSYMQIAWGALAFIVNKDNPVDNISLQQAKDIITGKIKNWKEIGGADKKINFYSRKAGNRTGVGYSVRKIVLGDKNKKLYQEKKFLRDTSGQIRNAVFKDKNGFGVGDVMSAKRVKGIKILKIDGVVATKENILEQKYLGYRPYFLYFPKNITNIAKKFRDFALSPEGQAVISKAGTANLDEGLASKNEGESYGEHVIKLKKDDTSCDKDKKFLRAIGCGIIRVAFIQELNAAFAKKYCTKVTTNKRGGDLKIIKEVHDKKAGVGIGCRALFKDGIEKKMTDIQIAWGALAFIVNKDNPLKNITIDQAKKIMTGKIKNWKELGGENKAINLYVRESKKSGIGSSARKKLFKNLNQDFYKKAKLRKSSGFIRDAIIKDKYGFAIDDATSSSRVKGVKILTLGGVFPNKKNILSKKYPLSNQFYIFLSEKPSGLVKKYVDFALSKEGQAIISKTGTANLQEATGKGDNMNLIFQQLKLNIKTR